LQLKSSLPSHPFDLSQLSQSRPKEQRTDEQNLIHQIRGLVHCPYTAINSWMAPFLTADCPETPGLITEGAARLSRYNAMTMLDETNLEWWESRNADKTRMLVVASANCVQRCHECLDRQGQLSLHVSDTCESFSAIATSDTGTGIPAVSPGAS